VGIDLLRALVALANGINPDPDYWTIGRVGALLVGNHEILAAGDRWGVDEGPAGEATRQAALTHDGRCSLIELLRTRHSEEPHPAADPVAYLAMALRSARSTVALMWESLCLYRPPTPKSLSQWLTARSVLALMAMCLAGSYQGIVTDRCKHTLCH